MTSTNLVSFVSAHMLFDSSASHFIMPSAFITQHAISYDTIYSTRNINTGSKIIIFNRFS